MSTPEQARRELAQSIETLITNGRYIDADAIVAAIEALIDAKLAPLLSEEFIESPPDEQYRVFCEHHDSHQARYTNGRPLTDDRCPWCVVEELQKPKTGLGFVPSDLS